MEIYRYFISLNGNPGVETTIWTPLEELGPLGVEDKCEKLADGKLYYLVAVQNPLVFDSSAGGVPYYQRPIVYPVVELFSGKFTPEDSPPKDWQKLYESKLQSTKATEEQQNEFVVSRWKQLETLAEKLKVTPEDLETLLHGSSGELSSKVQAAKVAMKG